MKTISLGNSDYKVAENWNELTPLQRQFLIVCPYLGKEGRTLDNEAAAFRIWLGMSMPKFLSLQLAPWQWGALLKEFVWLFETRPEGKPFDSFHHQGVNYHLFAPDYADTSALELAVANIHYLDFAHPEEPSQTGLDKLIATLCRPRRHDWRKFRHSPDWDGDIREEFNEQRMIEHAQRLKTLDLNIKLQVLCYFEQTNNAFLTEYGEMFGSDGQPRYGDGRGWVMLLKNVAKNGAFGDFVNVGRTDAHLLFASLLDDVIDHKEEAARIEAQRKGYESD